MKFVVASSAVLAQTTNDTKRRDDTVQDSYYDRSNSKGFPVKQRTRELVER
jgi:hypothetical protein